MVPILAGYIAVSIADKPGLVPGMIGGAIAADGSLYGSTAGAGFLGGIVAGFLAGYIAKWIKQIKVPKAMATDYANYYHTYYFFTYRRTDIYLCHRCLISSIFAALTTWLKGMQGANIIILALIIGAMIAFDMGGPINKVAFLGSALIAEGNYAVMGMVAVAVCTPPIGLGLATFIQKRKFNKAEQEMGKASFTMGLFGITEGAIPFAAQDPLRTIPANMIGAMVASVIAALGGVGDRVAHGGPVVAVLGGIDKVLWFFIAVIIGSLVTMMTVLIFKRHTPANEVNAHETDPTLENDSTSANDTTTQSNVATTAPQSEQTNESKEHEVFAENIIEISNTELTRDNAIDTLISKLNEHHYISNVEEVKEAILMREAESTTAIGMNVAIPHAKSSAVNQPAVAVMQNRKGIQWESLDGSLPQLVFLIAVPNDSNDTHLRLLQRLSKALMHDDTRDNLVHAQDKNEIYNILKEI